MKRFYLATVFVAAGIALSSWISSYGSAMSGLPIKSRLCPALRSFPTELGSAIPVDVLDPQQVYECDAFGEIGKSQRLFDITAWQAFIALNWPVDEGTGKPLDESALADNSLPIAWQTWMNADRVFKPFGAKPDPWSDAASGIEADKSKAAWRQHSDVNESLQAFSGPLIDRNGKWIHYELLINKTEYDYILANRLYSVEGQIAFSQHGGQVALPVRSTNPADPHGAIEVKLAWKFVAPGDNASRYITRSVTVLDPDTNKPQNASMELIGMHIAMRTPSSPEWIWTTFEHVDDICEPGSVRGKSCPVRTNFVGPDERPGSVNTLAPKNAVFDERLRIYRLARGGETPSTWLESATTTPTIVARKYAPSKGPTNEINLEAQMELRAAHSVLQYYKLIGTQWPIDASTPAVAGGEGSAPLSVIRKTPGRMTPVFLTNLTMETFFQKGLQPAGGLEQDDRLAMSAPPIDHTMMVGTESCVGCHYSAGIAIAWKLDRNANLARDDKGRLIPVFGENSHFGQTGSANFSWMLQLEAQSTQGAPSAQGAAKAPKVNADVLHRTTPGEP